MQATSCSGCRTQRLPQPAGQMRQASLRLLYVSGHVTPPMPVGTQQLTSCSKTCCSKCRLEEVRAVPVLDGCCCLMTDALLRVGETASFAWPAQQHAHKQPCHHAACSTCAFIWEVCSPAWLDSAATLLPPLTVTAEQLFSFIDRLAPGLASCLQPRGSGALTDRHGGTLELAFAF